MNAHNYVHKPIELLNMVGIATDPGVILSNEIDMYGYKDIYFQLYLLGGVGAAAADRTLTLTFLAHNGVKVLTVPQWGDVTRSAYDAMNYRYDQVSYTAIGAAAVHRFIDYDNYGYEKIRVSATFSGAPSVTNGALIVTYRRKAL